MAEIDEIIEKFKKMTKIECVKISVEKGETGFLESSFGGTPYLPTGFEYPFAQNYNKKGTQVPMSLLAQINFEEVPHFGDFPEKGILQIFINSGDDCYGINFDNPTEQEDYKIFYHADIDKNPENQQKAPNIKDYIEDDEFNPIYAPLKLSFKIQEQSMNCNDDRFYELFTKLYNKETGSEYENFDKLPDEIAEKVLEKLEQYGHRIGGYPSFTQSDPREYNEKYREYSTLLLQIDSEFKDGEDLILWGDCGVANFFIKPEDLKNCKFDDVLYNWDCC